MYYIIECIFGCWKFCLMNERKEIVRDKKALTTDFRISKQNKRKYVQIKSILTVHKHKTHQRSAGKYVRTNESEKEREVRKIYKKNLRHKINKQTHKICWNRSKMYYMYNNNYPKERREWEKRKKNNCIFHYCSKMLEFC